MISIDDKLKRIYCKSNKHVIGKKKSKFFLLKWARITLSLDLYGIGLIYTSASLGAATTNCLPVITFFLAVLLRYHTAINYDFLHPLSVSLN